MIRIRQRRGRDAKVWSGGMEVWGEPNVLFEILGVLCPVLLFFLIHLLSLCPLLLQVCHVLIRSRLTAALSRLVSECSGRHVPTSSCPDLQVSHCQTSHRGNRRLRSLHWPSKGSCAPILRSKPFWIRLPFWHIPLECLYPRML